jgi:[acyl-carrier-protein] S-malonyltransferase
MIRQLCSPVRWYESMEVLTAQNVDNFVEVGPGKVLTGLVKKSLPADYPAKLFSINSLKAVEAYLNDTA